MPTGESDAALPSPAAAGRPLRIIGTLTNNAGNAVVNVASSSSTSSNSTSLFDIIGSVSNDPRSAFTAEVTVTTCTPAGG